jgi:hypothetical protein
MIVLGDHLAVSPHRVRRSHLVLHPPILVTLGPVLALLCVLARDVLRTHRRRTVPAVPAVPAVAAERWHREQGKHREICKG